MGLIVNGESLVSGGSGGDSVVDYQLPTAENHYIWYRLYNSGWVEQGGYVNRLYSDYRYASFPIEMLDTNYTITIGPMNESGALELTDVPFVSTKSTLYAILTNTKNNLTNMNCSWLVAGMSSPLISNKKILTIIMEYNDGAWDTEQLIGSESGIILPSISTIGSPIYAAFIPNETLTLNFSGGGQTTVIITINGSEYDSFSRQGSCVLPTSSENFEITLKYIYGLT